MTYSNKKVAGALVFVAATQFVLGLIVSEALYPDYSTSGNYISDLGVGPSSYIYNSSVFLLGLLLIIGTYFFQRAFREYKVLIVTLILTSIGAMGVGVFTEDFGIIHPILSFITFFFGGLSAMFSVICTRVHKIKLIKMPFSIMTVVLGVMCLGALVLYFARIDLGLGMGGMERMIAYPILMWGAGFGAYLIAYPEETISERKPQ